MGDKLRGSKDSNSHLGVTRINSSQLKKEKKIATGAHDQKYFVKKKIYK